MLHTLSSTFFLCILTCCYYFLVTKDDYVLSLSHTHTHTSTFAQRESLSTLHDVVVNVFFFLCIVVVLSLSLCVYVDSYLFLSYKREKYNKPAQRVDKLFTPSMHLCMFFLFVSTHFFFFTYYQFSFSLVRFVTDKWSKKKECIKYIRRFKDDETKRHQRFVDDISSSFFAFLFYLFDSFFSHCMIRVCLLSYCVSKQQQQQLSFV